MILGASSRVGMILDVFRLENKVALVTGAATGLGQAVAIALAEAGADVSCHGNTRSPEATCEAIAKLGGKVEPMAAPQKPATETTFAGLVVDTQEITMSPTVSDGGLEKVRTAVDEYAFMPVRAKAKVGSKVTWKNDGKESHTATAVDGWSSSALPDAAKRTV